MLLKYTSIEMLYKIQVLNLLSECNLCNEDVLQVIFLQSSFSDILPFFIRFKTVT